ncbi:hypothetical protein BV394_02095 [Brevirhabdus pacifica]|uniref:Uncharacterized protein n=1 Tax=Brevirhabdus pacifica TaxID=1267768 RepID=A0A1U7DFD6_9RHOB|nr:hypothetical protein [Brevirhabdus pacifica]APX88671.1 hypothetical protein BV394_02095 [Brevirhabdus pacifica]OWU79937.1 hypothetical protein ATO5_02775 [Loktanella sp. 22II-4b]PJJ86825.1 hypothetical protein CLV77_1383 [Brevirhabdus pacifica]
MSAAEAAEARGVSIWAAREATKRHGVKFRDARKDPEFAAANAERMKRRYADPEFAAANAERLRKMSHDPQIAAARAKAMRRLHRDPAFNPLAALTAEERADYDLMKRNKLTRNEALTAIGRKDLIR